MAVALVCESLGKFRPIKDCKNGHRGWFYYFGGRVCGECSKKRHVELRRARGPNWNAARRDKYMTDEMRRARNLARNREFRAKNPDYDRIRKFGLSQTQYEEMVASQDGRCKICQEKSDYLAVDHSHSTGKIRGLLCRTCNTGIGLLRESRKNLEAAIRYLEVNA